MASKNKPFSGTRLTPYQQGIIDGIGAYIVATNSVYGSVAPAAAIRTSVFVGDGEGSTFIRARSPGRPLFSPEITRKIAKAVPEFVSIMKSKGMSVV